MQHPMTGAPLNYSIKTREDWDQMVAAAAFVAKKMTWSVGVWLDTKTWGVQFFAGSGALQGRPGFKALIRLTPWQEVRPEVSAAVWERYHTGHAAFIASQGHRRPLAGPKSFEEEFLEEMAAAEVGPGRPRRYNGNPAAATEAELGRHMARGLEELGGPLPPDIDDEPAAAPAAPRKRTRAPKPPEGEEPF